MLNRHFSGKMLLLLCIPFTIFMNNTTTEEKKEQIQNTQPAADTIQKNPEYKFPEFYKGIYLNVYSARNFNRLSDFIERSKNTGLNVLVLDVQRGKSDECAVPEENVNYCTKNGFHPIARVVVFQDGLSRYPVPESIISSRLNVAEDACRKGFKEIQFDYIRFSDYKISRLLTLEEKYTFIENFLKRARKQLQSYNVKIAADVFGRIPLNRNDAIGQKMEVFDRVVDVICPMAYPSHYTWSKKMMSDPYYTVYLTSTSAKNRSKNAEIVTYIQAFKMKIGKSSLTYEKYIEEQIKAVHDAGVKGFILWNASQKYEEPFNVMENYYKGTKEALNADYNDKSS
ncbi:MAG: hypothetical protein JW864_08575 [Spirochaetes bacterium]|nr:hypothetical protein [Spirochaetota bacterium]